MNAFIDYRSASPALVPEPAAENAEAAASPDTRVPRRDMLYILTVLYLAVPVAIFFVGWLSPLYAVLALLTLASAVAYTVMTRTPILYMPKRSLLRSILVHAAIVILTVGWVGLSGIGGAGKQTPDWLHRNAVLRLLVEEPWPPAPPVEETHKPLVSYVAYYLPAAIVGKVGGGVSPYALPMANVALWLWSYAGAYMSILWLMRLSANRSLIPAFVFVFFSGIDLLGWVLTGKQIPTTLQLFDIWLMDPLKICYGSFTSLLYWAPHQTIAAWLFTACLLRDAGRNGTSANIGLYCALAGLWSPFAAVGLVPIGLATAVSSKARGIFSPQNVSSIPLGLLIMSFLLSVDTQGITKGWLWDSGDLLPNLRLLLMFYLLNFAIYAVIAHEILKRQSAFRLPAAPYVMALLALLLIPLYQIGYYNDFCLRASIPALFVLVVYISAALRPQHFVWNETSALAMLLAVLLSVGSIAALNSMARSVTGISGQNQEILPPPYLLMSAEFSQLTTHPVFVQQYTGTEDALFFRAFGREPRPTVAHPQLPPLAGVDVARLSRQKGLVLEGWVLARPTVTRIEVIDRDTAQSLGRARLHSLRKDIWEKYPEYRNDRAGFFFARKDLASRDHMNVMVVGYSGGDYVANVWRGSLQRRN